MVEKLEWHPKLNVLWVFKWKPRVWVVEFGLVDSLALVPFNLHISFHLVYLVFCSWLNPQTFGTRLKWGWLNKTPIFDHFPVDSTSHLHTLYCKRFVRLRVLIKTHNINPLKWGWKSLWSCSLEHGLLHVPDCKSSNNLEHVHPRPDWRRLCGTWPSSLDFRDFSSFDRSGLSLALDSVDEPSFWIRSGP
jgi:hypothetical protein